MRSSEMPLVSIVIPVYNGSNYLSEAINSALEQTYSNIEIIVINDGSTDNGATDEVALSYKDKIRYFKKENGGVSSALNYGIKQMKGEYFAWLSHDDKHLPLKVEKQMDAIFSHDGNRPIICVCNYIVIDALGKELARSPEDIETDFRKSPKCFLGSEPGLMIDGDATLISRQLFDICGGFDESLFASQETDMWFRALEVSDFIFLKDYLVEYRFHAQQVSHRRAHDIGKEAGAYRGSIIEKVTLDELKKCYDNEKDATRFGTSAYNYMFLYFYEAAHQMIKKLRHLQNENWEYLQFALTGLFANSNIDQIANAMQTDSTVKSKRTKILVYCHEGLEDAVAYRLVELVVSLQSHYDFIWVSCDDRNIILPKNITTINFTEGVKSSLSTYLALIADLLDVNVFWVNSDYFISTSRAFAYLAESHIRTVASFHYSVPTSNAFSIKMSDEDWQSPLSKASMITHEKHDLMFTQYMYPYDAVSMPALSGNISIVEQWKAFFESLFLPSSSNKHTQNNFILSEDKYNSIKPVEALKGLQDYLENYEKYLLGRHIEYYERSIYWRITKPFRMIADLLKKLNGKRV